jgi:hypothetical protein
MSTHLVFDRNFSHRLIRVKVTIIFVRSPYLVYLLTLGVEALIIIVVCVILGGEVRCSSLFT